MKAKVIQTNLAFLFGVLFAAEPQLEDTDVGVRPLGLNGQRYLIVVEFAFTYQCKQRPIRCDPRGKHRDRTYTFAMDRPHRWQTSTASHSSCNS